eukprot:2525628-Amphidinium_carterae.1
MSVLEQVRCYAQVSKSCSSSEVCKLTEVLKTYSRNEALSRMEEHSNGVFVFEYSGDRTPVQTRKYSGGSVGAVSSRTWAMVKEDYFVQHERLSFVEPGGRFSRLLVYRNPQILEHGKSDCAMLSRCMRFLTGLGTQGLERGVTVFTQLHDRAMGHRFRTSIMGHLLSQRSLNVAGPSLDDGISPFTICLEGGRALHDLHTTLRWTCQVLYCNLDALLSDLYVATISLRKAVPCALRHLYEWFEMVLEVVAEE